LPYASPQNAREVKETRLSENNPAQDSRSFVPVIDAQQPDRLFIQKIE
jgi:hypothetical protein